jgi:enamine deaminase RidA (YjgF/YER057c/UK114 family)
MQRRNISSGSPWEPKVGYSRAVRVGEMVFVSGTLAADEHGVIVAPGDAFEQTRYALQKIERALREAGASMSDVVRTRMFVRKIEDFDAVGRAHAEFFAAVRPAATMVEVGRFAAADALIEIEVDAVIGAHLSH